MTTFDDREAAYEAKFVHDAETEFLAQASRNKHIAFWAAAVMGMTAEEAVRYAKDIIRVDLETAGEEVVVAKLMKDLNGQRTEERVRRRAFMGGRFSTRSATSLMRCTVAMKSSTPMCSTPGLIPRPRCSTPCSSLFPGCCAPARRRIAEG